MPSLTAIPSTLNQGDRYTITLTPGDYPAGAGWSLSLSVAGASVASWGSVASGDAHVLTIAATDSEDLAAGVYQWRVRATKAGGLVDTLDRGTLTVLADVGTAAAGELQSYAEQMLAICRQARQNILAGEVKGYMIDGRQVQLHTLADVAAEEAHWRRELARERRGSAFGRVPVGFSR